MKKISVVTVTYNCEGTIRDTINSIVNQDYSNFEYIIIDGDSKDSTKDIIREYSDNIDCFISEPDKGIFDAMNKALSYAKGDYIIFINSGDKLVDNTILSRVFNDNIIDDEDLVYGDVYIETIAGKLLKKANAIYEHEFTMEDLVYKSQGFSHQSLFTKTEALKKTGFDIRYPLGADYFATYKVYISGNRKIKYVGFPISIFDSIAPGASHTNKFIKEIYDERCRMFGIKRGFKYGFIMLKKQIETNGRYWIIDKFPKTTKKYREHKYEKIRDE